MVLELLDSLPDTFREAAVGESCMGSALKGALLAMKNRCGQLLVFAASIPSVGALALKSTRFDARLPGTDRELELQRPAGEPYRSFAAELAQARVSLELFAAPQQPYIDLASLAHLAARTGGSVRYYPLFHSQRDGRKLRHEVVWALTRSAGWGAELRIRMSRGWKVTKVHGHAISKKAGVLALPRCSADQAFTAIVEPDDAAAAGSGQPLALCIQAALLYTDSGGERRARVHTWSAATALGPARAPAAAAVAARFDLEALVAVLSLAALEHALKTSLSDARARLQSQCQQIMQAGGGAACRSELRRLPLHVLGMLKSPAFRATPVAPDLRAHLWSRLQALPASQLAAHFCPRLLPLHAPPGGALEGQGCAPLPDALSLSERSMSPDGVYLLEDGESVSLWIGGRADPALLEAAFGAASFGHLEAEAAAAALEEPRGDPLSERLLAIVSQVRAERPVPHLQLRVVRQGDAAEAALFSRLIEDRGAGLHRTYAEFLQELHLQGLSM